MHIYITVVLSHIFVKKEWDYSVWPQSNFKAFSAILAAPNVGTESFDIALIEMCQLVRMNVQVTSKFRFHKYFSFKRHTCLLLNFIRQSTYRD